MEELIWKERRQVKYQIDLAVSAIQDAFRRVCIAETDQAGFILNKLREAERILTSLKANVRS